MTKLSPYIQPCIVFLALLIVKVNSMHSPSLPKILVHQQSNQNCHVLNVRGGDTKNRTAAEDPKKSRPSQVLKCENGVCKYLPAKEIRGGAFINMQFEDDYDEYDLSEYDDEIDEEPISRPTRRATNSYSARQPQRPPQGHPGHRPPPSRFSGPPSSRGRYSRRNGGILGSAANLAKKICRHNNNCSCRFSERIRKSCILYSEPKARNQKRSMGCLAFGPASGDISRRSDRSMCGEC